MERLNITPEYISSVIEKLEVWREHDFHKDRQLADEVLIADGWKCEQNPAWEGGARWYIPGNPEYSTSESGRPHVLHDLNAAIGVIPSDFNLRLIIIGPIATAHVWRDGEDLLNKRAGCSTKPTIAVLIAALKAKRELLLKARAA
jgi:hypothetical protein